MSQACGSFFISEPAEEPFYVSSHSLIHGLTSEEALLLNVCFGFDDTHTLCPVQRLQM